MQFDYSKKRRMLAEQLETRALLATFGTPWPEPRSLSVSFPTDQAAIGAYRNTLREHLDSVTDRRLWQEATLRAFQTWSVHSNINIGLVPDRGDDFGAVGLSSNDPRFGEFRVGSFPQSNVLANALPYQTISGTWSGDVLINSEINYYLADLNSNGPISVLAPDEKGPAFELYSVLLHEAGNALGIADNNVPGSVMNGAYSGPNRQLKSVDIAKIRELYGARRDVFEPTGNSSRGTATRIPTPIGYSGQEPLLARGSLNTTGDVDFYQFTPLAGKEKVTVRLMASGISLVKAKLEVQDRAGRKIADVKTDSIFENNMQLEIGSLQNHSSLFVRVASNTSDVFGIGDYRIELDYRDPSLQPSIVPPPYDSDAIDDDEGPIDYLSVDKLFSEAGIVDRETNANDTLLTATQLETTPGFLSHTRYELQSSLATANDRDLWKFQAPAFASPTLQVTLDPVGLSNPELELFLLNTKGDRIASSVSRKPDGGLNLIVANPAPSETYVMFVRRTPGTPVQVGNYVATANFATNPATNMRKMHSANIGSQSDDLVRMTTYKTQLFRFDLIAQSANLDNAVQLSIHDERTGDLVANFAAAVGFAKTEFVWLGVGTYVVRTSVRNRLQAPTGSVRFSLNADTVSDDQGPRPINPAQPLPDWEITPITELPPIVGPIQPPFLPPWSSDFDFDIYLSYYYLFL